MRYSGKKNYLSNEYKVNFNIYCIFTYHTNLLPMINNITIQRFKNINQIDIDLDNITLLIGANNSGKSSILQSIQFAVSIAQTTSLEDFKLAKWKKNKLSTSLTPNQIIYTPLRDVYSLGYGGSLSQDKERAIMVKFKEKKTNQIANFQLRKGRNKNLLTEIEGQILGEQIRDIEKPYCIYVPGLAGIASFEELKSEGIIRRAAAKGDANNVFRNILWLLYQDPSKWKSFHDDFNDIFPDLKIDLSFDKLKDEYINAFIINKKNKLPIDAFGTGVLQAIQILSYIYLYSPKLLILDEPDSHLHPSNQRALSEKLIDLAQDLQFQLILSTHSRHLLDAFKDNALIKWIANGEIKNQEYNFISILLEIGALDKGDILNNGNTKCIILSEDSKSLPLRTVLTANEFDLTQTDIWSYEGCSKIEIAVVLAAFIKKNAPNTKIVIHRDSDYLSNEQKAKIEEKAKLANIDIFFTLGTDIESHFLSISHLQKIYPEIKKEDLKDILRKATEEIREKSLEIFINTKTQEALKRQYEGGEQVNNGQISIKCIEEYNNTPERYRHGKKVLKKLRADFQSLKKNKDLIVPTEDLKIEKLKNIKNEIWPNKKSPLK